MSQDPSLENSDRPVAPQSTGDTQKAKQRERGSEPPPVSAPSKSDNSEGILEVSSIGYKSEMANGKLPPHLEPIGSLLGKHTDEILRGEFKPVLAELSKHAQSLPKNPEDRSTPEELLAEFVRNQYACYHNGELAEFILFILKTDRDLSIINSLPPGAMSESDQFKDQIGNPGNNDPIAESIAVRLGATSAERLTDIICNTSYPNIIRERAATALEYSPKAPDQAPRLIEAFKALDLTHTHGDHLGSQILWAMDAHAESSREVFELLLEVSLPLLTSRNSLFAELHLGWIIQGRAKEFPGAADVILDFIETKDLGDFGRACALDWFLSEHDGSIVALGKSKGRFIRTLLASIDAISSTELELELSASDAPDRKPLKALGHYPSKELWDTVKSLVEAYFGVEDYFGSSTMDKLCHDDTFSNHDIEMIKRLYRELRCWKYLW